MQQRTKFNEILELINTATSEDIKRNGTMYYINIIEHARDKAIESLIHSSMSLPNDFSTDILKCFDVTEPPFFGTYYNFMITKNSITLLGEKFARSLNMESLYRIAMSGNIAPAVHGIIIELGIGYLYKIMSDRKEFNITEYEIKKIIKLI